jgi:hypothetical protein
VTSSGGAGTPLGIRRRPAFEQVWIPATPMGDVAVIYLEADDLETAFKTIGGSEEPFDRWFRAHVKEVHGIALEDGFPPPEQVLDFGG